MRGKHYRLAIAFICMSFALPLRGIAQEASSSVKMDNTGSWKTLYATAYSRRTTEEVMRSFSRWRYQEMGHAVTGAIPPTEYSIADGRLTIVDDDERNVISLSDIDLTKLSIYLAGAWHFQIRSRTGAGHVREAHLGSPSIMAEWEAEQWARIAVQDIYDLAWLAQNRTAQEDCLVGSLKQYAREQIHNNENKWGRVQVSGPILYQIADLVHGPTLRGGQTINFGIDARQGVGPTRVDFVAVITSSTGAVVRVPMGLNVFNPSARPQLGLYGLAAEPFAAGECIVHVDFENLSFRPIGSDGQVLETVSIDGITYIKGREPRPLGTLPADSAQ